MIIVLTLQIKVHIVLLILKVQIVFDFFSLKCHVFYFVIPMFSLLEINVCEVHCVDGSQRPPNMGFMNWHHKKHKGEENQSLNTTWVNGER